VHRLPRVKPVLMMVMESIVAFFYQRFYHGMRKMSEWWYNVLSLWVNPLGPTIIISFTYDKMHSVWQAPKD
jgi:hypothetical protein